jgi:YesN/AraC family two-component response regulator
MERYTHQSDDNTPWELLWVHFHGEAVKDYYEHFTKNGDNIFHPNSPDDYMDLIHQLLELHRNKPSSWEFTSSKLITDLLIHCMEQNHRPNHTSESINEKMYTIKLYFDQHFQEKIQLDTLATNFYVSKYHLSREFKRIFNTTVNDYLTVKRITYAKEQLRFTNKSIEVIGDACGYPDASYFNKVFRKVEAMTASEYRKKWRSKPSVG